MRSQHVLNTRQTLAQAFTSRNNVRLSATKAYDTQCDLSHTTWWIRQNLRMCDRVSPPTTPSDNVVGKNGRVQFSSDSIQFCQMGQPVK